MQTLLVIATLCSCLIGSSFQQPPGVPPKGNQQYQQQQQQQQQYQQQEQHHQQQQHQQQPQQQHGGGGHGHGHGHGGKPLEFAAEVHNAEHILEHLQNVVSTKPKEQMTEEELEFHYFKLHDYDNNNKLDGVEIGKALTHFHDDGKSHGADDRMAYSDADLGDIIDSALSSDDLDGDGYVEYPEFMTAQARMKKQEEYEPLPPGAEHIDSNGEGLPPNTGNGNMPGNDAHGVPQPPGQ